MFADQVRELGSEVTEASLAASVEEVFMFEQRIAKVHAIVIVKQPLHIFDLLIFVRDLMIINRVNRASGCQC